MRITNLAAARLALVLGLGLIAIAGLAMPASPALAHAYYERSVPAEGEVVAESPETIEIYFSQEMRRSGGLPAAIVVNESGDVVSLEAALSDEDRTLITVDLAPALPDGRYTVIWHNLSDADGDESQGAFHFYVGEGPPDAGGATPPSPNDETPATPTPAPAEPPDGADDGDDGVPLWGLIAGIVAAAVISGGAGLAIGRSRGG